METTETTGQQPAPPGETAPAPETIPAPEGTEQATETATEEAKPETEATAEAKPEKPEAKPPEGEKPLHPKTPKWAIDRFNELTREKNDARREAEAARAQLAELLARQQAAEQTTEQPAEAPKPVRPEVPLTQAQIEARAQQLVQQRQFDEACNKTHAAGMKDAPEEFAEAMNTFGMLGGIPGPALEVVTDMPEGHRVLLELGKTPDDAKRIFALPAAKMVRELTRLEANLAKPAKIPVSSAPKPITPIDGGARVETDPEKMSPEEFSKWWDKRQEARRKARYG